MIAENPENPLNLVAGGLYSPGGAYNNSTQYYGHGVSGAFSSFDGGRTWSDQYLPANANWSNSSSDQCDHNHLADTAVVFGPNDTVYYADLGYVFNVPGRTCSVGLAGTDLYVTVSHDGGRTWGSPVGVAGMESGSSIDKDWLALDERTGEVYVAYTDDGNGSVIDLQNSTDQGRHWSKPETISQNSGSNRGVELVVDPSGGVDALWIEQDSSVLYFTRSTNHGATFSKPVVVATALAEFSSPSPDAFRAYTLPALGVDGFPSNPYTGRLFATWQNGSGGASGSPAVSLSYSSDNGTHWTAPIRVNSNTMLQDYQPDVAVGADGAVYVEWYGENSTNGHYRLYGTTSRDGGRSYSPQVAISDVDSYPIYPSGQSAWWIGDYTHLLADAHGARPFWTDARARQEWSCSVCLWGYNYNITFYTAEMANGTIGSNVPVNLSVQGSLPLHGLLATGPSTVGSTFLVGEQYNLSAPASVTWNGSTWYFASWYGAAVSANRTVVGTVTGPTALRACYTELAGALCAAPGAPGYLDLRVLPANATVVFDGATVPLTVGAATSIAGPGQYWLNVSAVGYYPISLTVNITSGAIVYRNLSLPEIPGFIVGTVVPVNATVEVDGSPILVGAGGTFNDTVLPGLHTVRAYAYGWSTYTNRSVAVQFGRATMLVLRLSLELGWIAGSVDPANASLFLNGQPLASTDGFFISHLVVGEYWINATESGYVPASSGPLAVTPLATTPVALLLTPAPGDLVGSVSVPSAQVVVNGTVVDTTDGVFNATFAPGSYVVQVTAPGFLPFQEYANITSNTTTFVDVELTASAGWVVGSVDPANATVLLDWKPVELLGPGVFNVSLPPGTYALTAAAPGFVNATEIVRVVAGEPSPARLALAERPAVVVRTAAAPAAGPDLFALGLLVIGAAALFVVTVFRRRRVRAPSGRRPRRARSPRSPRPGRVHRR